MRLQSYASVDRRTITPPTRMTCFRVSSVACRRQDRHCRNPTITNINFAFIVYLEGHGDLVSRLIMGTIGVILWLTGVINVLTKPA